MRAPAGRPTRARAVWTCSAAAAAAAAATERRTIALTRRRGVTRARGRSVCVCVWSCGVVHRSSIGRDSHDDLSLSDLRSLAGLSRV